MGSCGHEIILRVTGGGHRGLSHSGVGSSAIGHRLQDSAADLSIQSSTQSSVQASMQPSFQMAPCSPVSFAYTPYSILHTLDFRPCSPAA